MTIISRIIFLCICAIKLDYTLIRDNQIKTETKIQIIILKYYLLAKHRITPFVLNQSHTTINKQKIYYETEQGLLFYQNMLTKTKKLVQLAHLSSTPTILDIGANVGLFTLLAKQMFPQSSIHAVEPIRENFEALKRNTEPLKKISCYEYALSNNNGHRKIHVDLTKATLSNINDLGNRETETFTLDTFREKNGISQIDLLKIDTETHELEVLQGAKKTLAKTKYILIEIAIENNQHYTFSQLISELYSNTYNFQLVGFRNFDMNYEGKVRIWDCLFENTTYQTNE